MGCSPYSNQELIRMKTYDYSENFTKNFDKGEIYYLRNVEEK
jgi:hypothetical protein